MYKDLFSIKDPLRVLFAVLTVIAIFFLSQLGTAIILVIVLALLGWSEEQIDNIISETSYWPKLFVFSIIAAVAVILTYRALKVWHSLDPKVKKKNAVKKTKKQPLLKRIRHDWRTKFLLLNRFPNAYDLIEVVLVYAGYFVSLFIIVALISLTGSIDINQVQDLGIQQPTDNSALWAVFLMLVILPPIWEETLFRGFLYNKLRLYSGIGITYVITGLLFGFAHFDFGNPNAIVIVDTMIFSGFLIYISQRHKSLYSAMFLHGIKNFIAFTLLFIL